jgi:endoribonuclease Dicer
VEAHKLEQPDYFPEQLLDSWSSFSNRGFYYCYKISLEGCLRKAISSVDIALAVKCDMGSDFVYNLFKLRAVHGDVNVTINYVGVIHLNKEQVHCDLRIHSSIIVIPSFASSIGAIMLSPPC